MKLEKITNAPKRVYDDACGTAHALELIGERWSLLIVRELLLGPRRFGDLRASLPGLSANVLTQRLEMLDAAGVVRRERLPPPASVQVYALTDWGREAEEAIKVLGRWAARSPRHDPTLPLSPVSLMLSFRTMFDPARAGGDVRVGFRFGEEDFHACIRAGAIQADRGPVEDADARLKTSPEAVAGFVYGGAPMPREAFETGDLADLATFARAFVLPDKA